MFHKSIRWRIQAWHTLLLICLVSGMLGAFYEYERSERVRSLDSQLHSLLTPLLPQITPPPEMGRDGDGLPPEWDRRAERRNRPLATEFVKGPFYFVFWRGGQGLAKKSPTAPAVPEPPRPSPGEKETFRSRGELRELVYYGPNEDVVVVGTSRVTVIAELHRLALELVGLGAALVGFGLAGGWWVAGHALRPIGEISNTARQIAGGSRAQRIDVRDTESELGQLAEVLNKTFDELGNAFEQQVRFTADASHELRTPVSVILTQVQLALSRERDAQEYRETLQICQRAAERMRALVNSLLELARVDSGEFQLAVGECDLAAVAADAMELIKPLARERGVTLRSSLEVTQIKGDATRLGQVALNLLNNSIQHNTREIEVYVSAKKMGDVAVLRVADNGAGIPPEALPHVFERFYRADKSRTGAKNGSGLGLAISQAIVAGHGGTIAAESEPGRGAVFTVSLPLKK